MGIDDNLLRDALASDPRYADAVVSGSNSELLALLNAEDTSQTFLGAIDAAALLGAIGADLAAVTAPAAAVILAAPTFDLANAGVQAALESVLPPAAMTRVAAAATRHPKFAEAFGAEMIALEDLWRVLPSVASSHLARCNADEFSGYAALRDRVVAAVPGTDVDDVRMIVSTWNDAERAAFAEIEKVGGVKSFGTLAAQVAERADEFRALRDRTLSELPGVHPAVVLKAIAELDAADRLDTQKIIQAAEVIRAQ